MPLGTLHWVPRHPERGRPVTLRRRHLQIGSLVAALLICALIVGSFMCGKSQGLRAAQGNGMHDDRILESELMQLRARIDNLSQQLVEISEREEQILVAGADLNLDFSDLLPRGTDPRPDDNVFQYIDDIELKLILSERLAEAELIAYDSLAGYFLEVRDQLDHTPSIWPARGTFVSDFGPRVDPFTGAVRYHRGIDIANLSGTPIYSPADGVVVFCGWTGGWGLNMVVRHSNRVSTRYAHCSSVDVVVGQKVQRGDLIGRIGSTGRSVGSHLHYEVLMDGVQVDPEDYIISAGPDAAVF